MADTHDREKNADAGKSAGAHRHEDPLTVSEHEAARSARGRAATRPTAIPLSGWRDILWRIGIRVGRDYVSLMAAGIAFFALLALFPALATLTALASIVFDPELLTAQMDTLRNIAPDAALDVLAEESDTYTEEESTLGMTALISLAISLFLASRGINNLIDGINMAYGEAETRGILRRNLEAVALTAVLTVLTLLALGAAVALPMVTAAAGIEGWTDRLVTWARWPLLALFSMISLALIYRYAPARRSAQWSWATPGAVAATAVWLAASVLFSIYVRNFGSYDPTYGALAGVVILLLWMWLTCFVVLLGAQLNAEMEHQTRHDTTLPPEREMGQRGAYMADTLGRRP
ncbi:MAG: YihY/virulence factor BrkB family protein [Rhodosalinus sp.]|uniref:YihY/virulence factor BrkB family protein n=1 Tax=Rhodosalinus sp. TaxID=2047741 RepID=UPI00397A8E25